MQRIHCLIGIVTLPQGEIYAECACGHKSYGDTEDEVFEYFRTHKRIIWREEA